MLCSSVLLLSSVSLFVLITGPLCQVDCLSPFHLLLFLRFCFVPSIGTYPPVSSLCFVLCVCFCALGQSAVVPSLAKVALEAQSRLPARASAQGVSHTWALCRLLLWWLPWHIGPAWLRGPAGCCQVLLGGATAPPALRPDRGAEVGRALSWACPLVQAA